MYQWESLTWPLFQEEGSMPWEIHATYNTCAKIFSLKCQSVT